MNEGKHTPGPWRIGMDVGALGVHVGPAGDDEVACVYGASESNDPEARPECIANARLIAAAPDLLAACRSAVESLEQLVRIGRIPANNAGLRDAHVAIARAEGR